MKAWRSRALLALICALFVMQCIPFIQRMGIEVDEALLANGIYERGSPSYSWHFGDSEIPVMLMSYLGALKSWIFSGLFAIWRPGPMVLRLPMAIGGAAVIWLLFRFLDTVHGRRAAWIGALLLATDSSFMLTSAIDYGPVVFQHVFKLGAVLLLVQYHRRRNPWRLAAAFFLLGLAVWDKAIFVWVIGGMAAGVTALRPRWIVEHLAPRPAAIAAIAFCAGAFPFLVYNVARPLEWVRQNARVTSNEPLYIKAHQRRSTVNGAVLFGFYTAVEPGPRPGLPNRLWQRVSFNVARAAELRNNGRERMVWIALLTLLVLSAIKRRRPHPLVLFSPVFLLVTWLAMLVTAGAGGAAHHVILLWPFHLVIVAVALAELPWRWVSAAITTAACIAGLLVTNMYAVDLIRNGAAVRWTDAFTPLIEKLEPKPAPLVFICDWGILETINLLTEGTVPILDGTGPLKSGGPVLDTMLASPAALYITHTLELEQIPGMRQKLADAAVARGLRKRTLSTITDRNGRPIFEIFILN